MLKKEPTRKERDQLRNHQEIPDAALCLFSEYGFHRVTMQQVADKAAVFCENLEIVRLYFQETSGAGFNFKAGLDGEIRVRHAEFIKNPTKVFAESIKRKRFNKIANPYFLAITVNSLTTTILLGCLEDPETRSHPQDPDILLNILFKRIFGFMTLITVSGL
ncbi:MAG: helix-turn-helix transcriptional regulator [Candidatus Krumholzibacteria bacterium]|nr:helix-turn-helix transcriptional regulator [Candidatus Krumholzibacteria bacterium]